MNNENYDSAVKVIKSAILKAQYEAVKSVNEKQLLLYFAIGKYISTNTRNGIWGEGAIDAISKKLDRELPGLRGFSGRNLRYMRTFYEEWSILESIPNSNLETAVAKIDSYIIELPVLSSQIISLSTFLSVAYSLHLLILSKVKDLEERIYYINKVAEYNYTRTELAASIKNDDYHTQGALPNNFNKALSSSTQAFKAISTFKDEYLLDFINTEEIDIRDKQDIDERVLENAIVHNIKKFILTFGKDFAFIDNQYHLYAFGVDQYIDLLFFNRELNSLVAIELKTGEFKTAYLGQLSGYLSVLDKFERKQHENPTIGIILCKDMDKSFVDFVISDYTKPMGVSTYGDISNKIKQCLPSIDDLKRIIENKDE